MSEPIDELRKYLEARYPPEMIDQDALADMERYLQEPVPMEDPRLGRYWKPADCDDWPDEIE